MPLSHPVTFARRHHGNSIPSQLRASTENGHLPPRGWGRTCSPLGLLDPSQPLCEKQSANPEAAKSSASPLSSDVKSLGSTRPPASDPAYRLLGSTITAERRGKGLGGNNIQAVLGAPSEESRWRHGSEQEVVLWLSSHWWVSLRNQFAAQPDVGSAIVRSAADQLGEITSRLTHATGAEAEAVTRELFERTFRASGPDYWR